MDEFNKELFFLASQLTYQLNQVDASIDYLQNALALDQHFKKAILFLANIYTNMNQYTKVIELINQSKQAGATDPLYDWESAKAYNEEEQYKEALKANKEERHVL